MDVYPNQILNSDAVQLKIDDLKKQRSFEISQFQDVWMKEPERG